MVDDHQIVREGVVAVLARETDFEIVGEGSNGAEAIDLVRQRKPDVALMDAQMPGNFRRGDDQVHRSTLAAYPRDRALHAR